MTKLRQGSFTQWLRDVEKIVGDKANVIGTVRNLQSFWDQGFTAQEFADFRDAQYHKDAEYLGL